MIELAFHGQDGVWTVDEAYDSFTASVLSVRYPAEGPAGAGLLEVELADGMYATLGSRMRMMVDPRSIAWYRDLDGVRRT